MMKSQTTERSTVARRLAAGIGGLGVCLILAVSNRGEAESTIGELESIEIVDFGIYAVRRVLTVEDEQMPGGDLDTVEHAVLIRQTDQISAELGLSFGVRMISHGKPDGKVVGFLCRDHYPGLTDPRFDRPIHEAEFRWETTLGELEPSLFTTVGIVSVERAPGALRRPTLSGVHSRKHRQLGIPSHYLHAVRRLTCRNGRQAGYCPAPLAIHQSAS